MTEKLCGIFTLKGIKNQNKVRIKHVENILLKKNEYVSDTLKKNET